MQDELLQPLAHISTAPDALLTQTGLSALQRKFTLSVNQASNT
jgi:hypothetical protein